MIKLAVYFSVFVVITTALAYWVASANIAKIKIIATKYPEMLRGATAEDALAKVAQWERTRARLWPTAGVVILLTVVCAAILPN